MAATSSESGTTLPALLAARARGASDLRLTLDCAVGLLAALLIAFGRPPLWPALLPAAVCFLAYGTWGIADRELRQASRSPAAASALRALRALAAAAGYGAGVVLLFALVALALGQWIS